MKNVYSMGLFLISILFLWINWEIDGFEIFTNNHKYYFQSWVSLSGSIFSLIMAFTIFFIYKKSNLQSLKYIGLSFIFVSLSYATIGYHSSYCKVCSDLSVCSASHNYSNYFVLISLIILVTTILLLNIKKSINFLMLFSYSLIGSSFIVMIILFTSVPFMETPSIANFIINDLNIQGFIYISPILLIVLAGIYMHSLHKLSKLILFLFIVLSSSFLPQAYHLFTCNQCNIMECSEFFSIAGLLMFIATGLLIRAISCQFDIEKWNKNAN